MVLGRTSLILEFVGTVLMASSLAGAERVQRWETKIRSVYDIPRTANYLTARWKDVYDILLWVVFVVFWVAAIIAFLRAPDVIVIVGRFLHIPEMFDQLQVGGRISSVGIVLGSCCVFILLFVPIMMIVWFPLRTKAFGYTVAILTIVTTYILATLLLMPITIGYVVLLVLLIPYFLADRASVRFDLQRPVLGVLGTVLLLVGLLLQFPEQFGLF